MFKFNTNWVLSVLHQCFLKLKIIESPIFIKSNIKDIFHYNQLSSHNEVTRWEIWSSFSYGHPYGTKNGILTSLYEVQHGQTTCINHFLKGFPLEKDDAAVLLSANGLKISKKHVAGLKINKEYFRLIKD